MSWVQIVHQIPGRTRLRSPVLRRDQARCTQVAELLATVPDVHDVAARPYTGTVLVHHARSLAPETLVETIAEAMRIEVLRPGASPLLAPKAPPFSSVARKLVIAMRELDADVRRKSEGTVDLGTLVTIGMFGAGAAEVAISGKLPIPPWFTLAWWGYRTFMTAEREEIEAGDEDS